IGVILIFILQKNKQVDTGKFIRDNGNWIRKFKESDYDFLVRSKYGENAEIIGDVTQSEETINDHNVVLNTKIGGKRIIGLMYGEGLPRIC
ncbi:MAG: hypothetical protein J6N21_00885, partial [Butyrivibrio sp.]|nr:hypothetical protein [Butyrivibrio sp.]